jgi:hypothetical protein
MPGRQTKRQKDNDKVDANGSVAVIEPDDVSSPPVTSNGVPPAVISDGVLPLPVTPNGAPPKTKTNAITWAEFLEHTPPGIEVEIESLVTVPEKMTTGVRTPARVRTLDIRLYCDSDGCKDFRFFRATSDENWLAKGLSLDTFITYRCRTCMGSPKTFAVRLTRAHRTATSGTAIKFGEEPAYAPPISPSLVSLVGPGHELFSRGHRCESQGLGLAAFVYYRRVVVDQKSYLIYEIADAARRLGATPEDVAALNRAAQETQFRKATENITAAIPSALLIQGHDPLTLLYTAVRRGFHAGTDEEYLTLAKDIRIVLTELAGHTSAILKDEADIRGAVTRILSQRHEQTESEEQVPTVADEQKPAVADEQVPVAPEKWVPDVTEEPAPTVVEQQVPTVAEEQMSIAMEKQVLLQEPEDPLIAGLVG